MIHKQNAILVLETGEFFGGLSLGVELITTGILCFNTAMSGYQEAISDPSYAGQILVFTFPHIGNVGVNVEDCEASRPYLQAIVLGDVITEPSNYRHTQDLPTWLRQYKIPGIMGVNTRKLTQTIRDAGKPVRAALGAYQGELKTDFIKELQNQAMQAQGLDENHIERVATGNSYEWGEPLYGSCAQNLPLNKLRVVVIDFGVKNNILRILRTLGCAVIVVPNVVSYEEICSFKPQAVVLSNGPGDPRSIDDQILVNIEQIIAAKIPVLGICLGYQLLARLYGANIVKLPHGHHGINHPVKEIATNRILITSQNHEFVVEENSLPALMLPTHRSLFDNTLEGFAIKGEKIIVVQFHPEGAPGPQDAITIFTDFINMSMDYAEAI